MAENYFGITTSYVTHGCHPAWPRGNASTRPLSIGTTKLTAEDTKVVIFNAMCRVDIAIWNGEGNADALLLVFQESVREKIDLLGCYEPAALESLAAELTNRGTIDPSSDEHCYSCMSHTPGPSADTPYWRKLAVLDATMRVCGRCIIMLKGDYLNCHDLACSGCARCFICLITADDSLCEICNKKFKNKAGLSSHMRHIHNKV